MNRRISVFVTSLIVSFVVTITAYAHHGWGGYKEPLDMIVTITELKLGNPHDRLIAKDHEDRAWNLLLAPPARNRRFGFTEETLSVGDTIEILGQKHPSRDEVKVHCITMNGENVYTYRYDGGRTSLARRRERERTGRDSCE